MSLILGFDVETTGLDPKVDRIIEVGAVLYDWERKTPVEILSTFVLGTDPPNIPEHIRELTGITDADVSTYGRPSEAVGSRFIQMAGRADAWMAHNAPFDLAFLPSLGIVDTKIAIDTVVDLPLDPKKHGSRKLLHLGASHGFVNPFQHRAVFDVFTMLEIASRYPLDVILARAKSPTVTAIAQVSFAEKEKAKAAGFHWEAASRTWERRMKSVDIAGSLFDFETTVVN